MAKNSTTDKAFAGLSSLIKLLPTGSVFLYQFLNPLLLDDTRCGNANKILSSILIVVCGLTCFISSFTDTFKGNDGVMHYGIATLVGLWPNPDSRNLSSYKIRLGDFVHAFFALIVFAGVALLNDDSVECFYPSFKEEKEALVAALPTVVGVISSAVFAFFPTKRNYIGYTDIAGQK